MLLAARSNGPEETIAVLGALAANLLLTLIALLAAGPMMRLLGVKLEAMVTRLLGLDAVPKPADAADALALAICHVWRGSTTNRLQAAVLARAVAGRR